MIDVDDLGHLLEAVDVSVEARKEVPDADRTAGLGDRPRMVGICRPLSGVGAIARDPNTAVCDNSSGLLAILTVCIAMSSVAWATSQMKPIRWQARITSAPNSLRP
jgi:hypothetical protein